MRSASRSFLIASMLASMSASMLMTMSVTALAQSEPPPGTPGQDDIWKLPNRDVLNANTVTIIAAPAGGATAIFASDMARVLDDANMRVLPVLGKGPVRNVIDILYLRTIDMGMVASDVPEFYKLQYKIPDVASRLRYIAKLYNNEIHVIAPTSVKSIFELDGKRIMAPTDVGYYSAKVIFARLGINATFDYWTDDGKSIQKLVDGEADAYIVSTGKVFGLARAIKNEDRRLHLVPIPYDRRLQDMYFPATLSSEEYPNLLEPGEKIETIATSVLLVSFNWPENTDRYRRTANFINALFSKIDEFHKPPRHPKWAESSLNIKIPGWERFKAADDWIAKHTTPEATAMSKSFYEFLDKTNSSNLSSTEKERLLQQFMEWRRARGEKAR